jgi:ABC-2 type transport system ATP-binding protein
MSDESAIRLEGVTKSFGVFTAVSDLSFSVKRGTICGFLGPNGAGKTTSVRMMLGLEQPTSGAISILGATGQMVKDRIGFLPEERGLYRKMKAIEVIVFMAGLKGVKSSVARKRGLELLEAQGLGKFAHEKVQTLSKGMSQKVQMIATLVHEPELLILDEPFSGLDPVNQEGLEQVIRDAANRGATVLFSTHVMAHAERLCQDVVMLAKGQKVFDGTLAQAKAAAPRYLDLVGPMSLGDLMDLPGVAKIEAVKDGGLRWRITLTPEASVSHTLKAAYLKGLEIERFELKEPTLHDAFIVLTQGGAAHV